MPASPLREGYWDVEWNLSTIVDSSLNFLFQEYIEVKEWFVSRLSILLNYLAGLLDAEGSIVTTRDNRGFATMFVDHYNTDKVLFDWVQGSIRGMGHQTSPRINKEEGVKTMKHGITYRGDYWQLSTFGMDDVQDFVRANQSETPREGQEA